MADIDFIRKEYHLKTNPFFDTSYGPKHVNRKDTREDLYKRLSSFVEIMAPQILFITGAYGIGKTYTLFEIENDIKEKKARYIKPEKMLSCYIRMTPARVPTDYFLYIYQEIIRALGRETFERLCKEFRKITESDQKENKLTDYLSGDYKSILSLVKMELEETVWDYLLGNKIAKSRIGPSGSLIQIDSGEIAKLYLIDFLKLIKTVGYKSLVVLIDEFENIFTLAGKNKTAQVLTVFRELYDEIQKQIYNNVNLCSTIFIFASASSTHEDVIRLIQENGSAANQAFIDRTGAVYIDLLPFKGEYVKELIEIKIDLYRSKEIDDKLFPFKEDFIEYIREITGGNPRYVLQYAATILDSASEKGYKAIGRKEAEEIVIEKNLG